MTIRIDILTPETPEDSGWDLTTIPGLNLDAALADHTLTDLLRAAGTAWANVWEHETRTALAEHFQVPAAVFTVAVFENDTDRATVLVDVFDDENGSDPEMETPALLEALLAGIDLTGEETYSDFADIIAEHIRTLLTDGTHLGLDPAEALHAADTAVLEAAGQEAVV